MRARVLPLALTALTALLLCVHSASGLQCHTCSHPNCSSGQPVTCAGDSKCSTAVMKKFSAANGGRHSMNITKGCVPAQNCSSLRPVVWSFNFSVKALFAMSSCCDGDNCNAASGSETPMSPMTNMTHLPPERQGCYMCDPRTRRCNMTWCGPEEVCARAQVLHMDHGPVTLYGCLSQSLCNTSVFEQHFGGHVDSLYCCDTDNCNVPEERFWRMDNEGWLGYLLGLIKEIFYDSSRVFEEAEDKWETVFGDTKDKWESMFGDAEDKWESMFGDAKDKWESVFKDEDKLSVFASAERVLPLTLFLPLVFFTLLFNT